MREDRGPLGVWLLSRAAVAVLVLAGTWQLGGTTVARVPSFLSRWDRWDVGLFRKVAEFGYAGFPQHYPDRGIEAFFPGFPLVLALVHRVVPDWTAAGLLVSLVAGAWACRWLGRLAALDGVDGTRAALYLVLSPYAVFLAAGYSEALFLALALPGWWCARRGHWAAAGLLVAGASAVRVSGLFLAVGLVGALRRDRAPAAARGGLAARAVRRAGGVRRLPAPPHRRLAALDARAAGGLGPAPDRALGCAAHHADRRHRPGQGTEYAWSWYAEVAAVLVGVAVTAVLLRRARWGEATYVGLSVAALATSSFYLSVARATLLWFPLWLLLAEAAQRRPWLHTAYLSLSAPLMAVGVLAFTSGRWVG